MFFLFLDFDEIMINDSSNADKHFELDLMINIKYTNKQIEKSDQKRREELNGMQRGAIGHQIACSHIICLFHNLLLN